MEHFRLHVRIEVTTLIQRFNQVNLVTQLGRDFVFTILRRFQHFGTQLLDQLRLVAVHEHLEPFDVLAILFLRNAHVARSRTLINAGQQTRPEPAPAFIVLHDVQRACTELEYALEHLHGSTKRPCTGKWPV